MRYILILLLIGCLASQTFSRPTPGDESEEEETEYENEAEGPEGDATLDEDYDSRVGPQETAVDEQDEEPENSQRLQESNRNTYLQRRADEELTRENSENCPSKSGRNSASESESLFKRNPNELHLTPEQHDSGKYMEKSETNDPAEVDRQLLGHMDSSKSSDEQTLIDQRTVASNTVSNEEGDDLFENHESLQDRQRKGAKSEYSGAIHSNEQSRYSRKYYNPMHEGVPNKRRYDNHINLDRDRRALQETNDTCRSESNIREEVEQSSAEDEEAAIKRHVKKLSVAELDELLGSLSDEKRELLKKIMDNDFESSFDINKREITKKAGAAPDENTYLEGGSSDSSKLQESVGSGENSQAQSSEATESNKLPNPQASEITILPVTKSLETSNDSSSPSSLVSEKKDLSSFEISHPAENNDNNAPIADSNNQAKIVANEEPSKAESKRETNSDDLTNMEKSMDEDDAKFDSDVRFVDSQELLNELAYEDVPETNNKNENIMKRDTYSESENDMAKSIKSLEESFPNANAYDDDNPYSGSDMAPLVRVKRKNSNLIVKKRAAGVLPDAKVAFCPYRAENDEDNEEGNEFDDDGFYDRTSNLAKSHVKAVSAAETHNNFKDSSLQLNSDEKVSQLTSLNQQKLPQLNGVVQGGTTSLGSDTDNVLSGVEGVDENLMINSASRNKRSTTETRTADDDRAPKKTEENLNHPVRSTPVSDDEIKRADGNSDATNYHENDAFGGLPRNYEGDLGRYKRIRHVKQLPALQDVPSSSA